MTWRTRQSFHSLADGIHRINVEFRRQCGRMNSRVDRKPAHCSKDWSVAREEDVFNRLVKCPGNCECKRQARVVLAALDRNDGLPRHIQLRRQVSLGQIVFGTQHTQAVLHQRYRRLTMAEPMAQHTMYVENAQIQDSIGAPKLSSRP